MDPEATLKRAEQAIEDEDFQEAREALDDYRSWRARKGFQPRGGDKRADELEAQLGDEDEDDPSELDRDEVIAGFADAIWQTSWADACERAVEDGELDELPWSGGDDISEIAPETPDKALAIAKQEIARMERANKSRMTLVELYEAAGSARYDAPDNSEQLGFQLGMQWLGTGVGLPHEKAVRAWDVGHGEVLVEISGDPFDATIGYASGSHLSGVKSRQG